jgi:hypothetical protein
MTDEAGIAEPEKIFIATQRGGKRVSAAMNNDATTELISRECELVPVWRRGLLPLGGSCWRRCEHRIGIAQSTDWTALV